MDTITDKWKPMFEKIVLTELHQDKFILLDLGKIF